MSENVWLVTGAGRGMGVHIVKAALAADHAVVATGRNPEKVGSVLGAHDDLLVVALDVTDPNAADIAVQAAVERFGRVDVLVNNAGNFNAGFFEKLSPEDFGRRSRPPLRPGQRHPFYPSGHASPALRAELLRRASSGLGGRSR